jgi:tetratricopeptide (TPR) repeat protein
MSDASQPRESRHDRLYKEATALAHELILLDDREAAPLDDDSRRRLGEAIALYEEVVRINPKNWAALWMLGKVHQRLGEFEKGLAAFARSHDIVPDQPDVAREASIAAMDLGRPEEAVVYCRRALQAEPDDPGLRANLGLALLFSGKPEEARVVAEEALRQNPADEITARILAIIGEVLAGTRPCPHHVRDLE